MSADTDYAVLRDVLAAIDLHSPSQKEWAVEFGVYSGLSLGIIAAYMPVIGFDSFEGLPEDWREGFSKGTFATEGDEALYFNTPAFNQMLIKGWFEDTAPNFPFPPLRLVHIDCDLYSSTVTALESVVSAIGVGTVVVFDEYHGYPGHEEHEMKAWTEFCLKYRIVAPAIGIGPEEAAFVINKIEGEKS